MPALRLAKNPVQQYSPTVFDELPLFKDSKEALRVNRARLRPLGGVILQHGLAQHCAISLLHKHFPMYRDEFLQRSFDMTNRTVTMQPSKRGKERSVPYLWRAIRQGKGEFTYFPLEFVREEDANDLRDFNLDDHPEFLSDMAQVLAEHDLLDVFGVAHPQIINLKENSEELLVETTDSANRILTVRPEPGPVVGSEELTETLWIFTPTNQEKTETGCTGTHCAGHCHGHCIGHCVGHCHNHHEVEIEAPA